MKESLRVAFAALILLALFDLQTLSTHEWKAEAFIMERKADIPLEQGWDIGYDAQWYYAIALDPFGAAENLDMPAYRYQRILFPLLARVFSLGQTEGIPWAMLAINLLAGAGAAGLLAGMLRDRGASPWFGLVFPLSAGSLLAIRMDLLEPLALALGLAGWLACERRKWLPAWLFFALAGLTKEAALVFPLAAAIGQFSQGDRRRALFLFSSAAAYIVWFLFLQWRLGTSAGAMLASTPEWIPFRGLLAVEDSASRLVSLLWAAIPAALGALAALILALRRRTEFTQGDVYLLLGQAALVACAPQLTWVDPLAMLRVSLGVLAALVIWLGRVQPRGLPFAAAYYLPASLILYLAPGFVR
ncbi:MAG: hypothetical protein L0Z70_11600 [Chloroflexi bacterium]|nr:hypothetical protein [Chloroflexota bacterium]